ncbi:MAG: helix-turn-helix transcriptional regulator [Methylobacterium sp.]|uniref:helix-turn-helix domain-containing protein n=1 Tax=Methylobacterium sp. TaxID=409 RepID=UPI0027233FA5|nr:helix-turn-helix transcriptional regulator [Methylobacterium sp.]MDO9428149.1 helix-turn-helix transcriptional regulator [Methylobacterium sp.]
MKPQILTTENGEELVVLARRDYDALLACLGDETAEDRRTVAIARTARSALDTGTECLLPVWFSDGLRAGLGPLRVVREHFGRTPDQMAGAAGITVEHLADLESGGQPPSIPVLDAISASVVLDPRLLQRLYAADDRGS